MKCKLGIRERLKRLLQDEEIRLFILKSSLTELSNMAEKGKLAFEFAKEFCEVINDNNAVGDSIHDKIISIFRIMHSFLFLSKQ